MSLPKKSGGSFKKSAMSLPKKSEGRSKNQQCRFPKNQGVVQKISKKSGKKSASERPKSEIENLGESMQMSEQRNSQVFAKCVQKTWTFRCDVVAQMLLSKNQQKIRQTTNVAFKKSAKNQPNPKCCFQKISKKSVKKSPNSKCRFRSCSADLQLRRQGSQSSHQNNDGKVLQ